MHVTFLGLHGFRNLQDQECSFDSGLTMITGDNGAGKTNFLEALSLVTGWGTFPGRKVGDVPLWDLGRPSIIRAHFSGETFLDIQGRIEKQNILRCGDKRRTAAEIRSRVPALFFLPSDMELVEGGAGIRRRFLNRLCAFLHPLYGRKLHEYNTIHRQRTFLLRQGKDTRRIDGLFASSGSWIWHVREKAMKFFLHHGMEYALTMLSSPVTLRICRGGGGMVPHAQEDFRGSLARMAREERRRGRSLVGPHGDDVVLETQGRSASMVLSRGQRRRLVLALMLGMGHVVCGFSGKKPLFILDEVIAELDVPGRELLFHVLEETRWQVLAATAEPFLQGWPGVVRTLRRGVLEP